MMMATSASQPRYFPLSFPCNGKNPPQTVFFSRGRGFPVPGPLRAAVVGIDLGTTNSAVATLEEDAGRAAIVTNAEGQRITPSVVAYTETGQLLVGQIAKSQAAINPHNTFFSLKRLIGRKLSEIDVGRYPDHLLSADDNGNVILHCPAVGKHLAPHHISAHVLRKLVDDASTVLNQTVNKAVVAVPAYFNDSQRMATKDAGLIAGLDVLGIINEPTAVSLAYGFHKNADHTIQLVLDLGGGTFDVSVLQAGDGVLEVLSTSGDAHLGGDDFDKRIVDWIAENFKHDEGIDLLEDKHALQLLNETAERVKIELSTSTQASISLPFITATPDGPKHIETTLTRATYEDLCSDLLDKLKAPLQTALRDAKLSIEDIDQVILAGGSTRIPAVQDLVKKMTGKEPNCSINPDEIVALGAAVQAGVLAGEVRDVVLLDVTPLSIGLETLGGIMTKIIPRNTKLPVSKTHVFSTATDGQTSVEVNVLEGERVFVEDNKFLGSFRLHGIPPSPRGVPQVQVKFEIDTGGVLSVTALDKGTKKEQVMTIIEACNLPKDEVDKMVEEAERFAEEDKEKRDAIDARNKANFAMYETEKHLRELGDKVPVEVKENVEAKLEELREVLSAGSGTRAIKNAMVALNQELMQLGQSIYYNGGNTDC